MVQQIKSAEEFQNAIKTDKLVVVDFYADWCGPCKMIAPAFAKLNDEFPDVLLLKINVDEQEELAMEHSIEAMPTFKLIKGGKVVETILGASIEKIKDAIRKHSN